MRSISKFLLALIVGLAGVLAVTGPAAASPPPPTQVGGLDLGAYCRTIGHTGAALTGATAYDWRCTGPDGGLSFADACRWTYRSEHVVDRIDDFYNPRSVTCWMVQPDIVVPDFEKYCTTAGFSASALVGTTVYDWRCVNYNRAGATYFDIDVAAACKALTYGYARLDRFGDFRDASSWQCRV